MVSVRPANRAELAAPSDQCRRSKAHRGYSADVLAARREEPALTEREVDARTLPVAEEAGAAVGLPRRFVEPAAMGRGLGRDLNGPAMCGAREAGAPRIVMDAVHDRVGARRDGLAPSGSVPDLALPRLALDLHEREAIR